MAVSEFWMEQAVDFVRKLRGQCDRCPDCGALACGPKHENWHTAVQTKLNETDANFATASQAIQSLRNRMTAAETEITDLKARVTALGG